MKQFPSVEETMNDMRKNYSPFDKFITNPKNNWLRWLIYNAKDVPSDLIRKCKRGWQRAYWGVAEEDVWGMDWYLSKVILRGLKRLKETKHGCPALDGYNCETDFEEMKKEWDTILDGMIWTFEVTQKIQDFHWVLWPKNGWNKKQYNTYKKLGFAYLMTEEETKKYYQGWENFKTYYFSLWD